VMVVVAL